MSVSMRCNGSGSSRAVGMLLLCLALASCAQLGSAPANNAKASPESRAAPAAAQAAAPNEAASGQKEEESGWSSPIRGRRWCGPPIPENENFFHKVTRLLFSRDWCGPDPDVDTNIQAGGAAGG
jgi:hypothetical protein